MQKTKHIKKNLKVNLCKNDVLSSPGCQQATQNTFFFSETKLLGDLIISSWDIKMKNKQTKLTEENVHLFRSLRFLETYRGTEIPKNRKSKVIRKTGCFTLWGYMLHSSVSCLRAQTSFLPTYQWFLYHLLDFKLSQQIPDSKQRNSLEYRKCCPYGSWSFSVTMVYCKLTHWISVRLHNTCLSLIRNTGNSKLNKIISKYF